VHADHNGEQSATNSKTSETQSETLSNQAGERLNIHQCLFENF